IGPDRDVFTLEEMAAAFDSKDVNPNPARFDLHKPWAINADHMRMIPIEDMTERVIPFLQRDAVLSDPVTDDERGLLERAMPLVHERMNKRAEAPALLGFLFADEESFTRDEADTEKVLDDDG